MASMCLSITTSKTLAMPFPGVSPSSTPSPSSTFTAASRHTCRLVCCRCSLVSTQSFGSHRVLLSNSGRAKRLVVRMAPEEERLTRRNPLDFPVEWERPRPGRRPDIFPQFSPMKTPLPPPLPYDPPEEDEEEEEKKEEEEDPEKEEQEQPENQ